MARVKYGALVTSMHGAIGGTVFQSGAKGSIARNKGFQALTLSPRQELAKQGIVHITQLWSSLSDAVRTDFNSFATTFPQFDRKTGTRQLSGYEVFLMYNLFLSSISSPIITSITLTPFTLPSVAPTLRYSASKLYLDLHESASQPSAAWAMFFSRSLNAGITNPGSKLRYVISDLTGIGEFDVTMWYNNKIGSVPITGDTVFIDAKPYGLFDPFVYARQRFKLTVS